MPILPPTKPYGVIYLLTNSASGKYYVGQTTNLPKRMYVHKKSQAKQPLARAIQKYGFEIFTIDILARAESREQLNAFEALWILLLRSQDRELGYNLTGGGDCPQISEDSKRRMSKAQKRNPVRYWLGKKRDMSSVPNWGANRILPKSIPKVKVSKAKFTKEQRAQARAAALQRYRDQTPDWKKQAKNAAILANSKRWEKQRACGTKTCWSDEAKARRKISAKVYWADPEKHERLRQQAINGWQKRRENRDSDPQPS